MFMLGLFFEPPVLEHVLDGCSLIKIVI